MNIRMIPRPFPYLRPCHLLLLLPLLLLQVGRVNPFPRPQVDFATPSPPVILDDADDEYTQDADYDYEWRGSSLVEQELKDIHTRIFTSKDDEEPAVDEVADAVEEDPPQVEQDKPELSEIEELLRLDPEFVFEPVGVEISGAVISQHKPNQESDNDYSDVNPTVVSVDEDSIFTTNQQESVEKEAVDDLSLVLTWWQILILILACVLLASLCCYFSGCCFLVADCCSDPFWGCCPCCKHCVRLLKPNLPEERVKETRTAPNSSYSLNENNTAPRSSLHRSSSGAVRNEKGSTKSVNGAERRTNGADRRSNGTDRRSNGTDRRSSLRLSTIGANVTNESNDASGLDVTNEANDLGEITDTLVIPSTPCKPRRTSRASRESLRLTSTPLQTTQDDSMTSTNSIRSVRNYRRMSQSQTNNSLKASSTGLPHSSTGLPHSSTGLPGTDSLHRRTSSLRGRTNSSSRRKDDSLGRRGAKSPHRGEPSQNWVYEDSSGYFSWISKLGGKKKQYQVYPRKKKGKSSQKNIYRQSKYYHIPESRNSAVIPVKISKRMSTHSNYNITRQARARSVESMTSEDEEIQPFLQTKSERHLPSRLSSNLADLETRRTRRQSGGSTPVSCPTVPVSGVRPAHSESCNLENFEKSLLGSKETTL